VIPQKDLELITHLRQDARAKLTTLSRKIHMPVSTIFEKLKYYHGNVVERHVALINFARIGYHVRAYMVLRFDPKDKQAALDYLKGHQNTNSLYKINNGYDCLLETIFRDLKDVEDFQEMLDIKFKVKGKNIFYLIDEIVRETFMAKPELVGVV
jgi:Lrp/AsnC family transcriptional regulator, leucine-responsive regulatory protein